MKNKKYSIVFILLLNMLSVSAQLSLSPNIGFNISSLSNVSTGGMRPSISYDFGIDVNYNFTNLIGIQSGFFITSKGANDVTGAINIAEHPVDAEIVSMDAKTTYLKLPLMFSLKHSLYKELYFRLNIGPYFSYGVSSEGSLRRIDGSYSIRITPFDPIPFETASHGKQYFPAFNRWDIGCGFNLELIMYDLKIGTRYDLGFSDVSDKLPTQYGKNIQNRTCSIYIGYVLPFLSRVKKK